MQLGSLMMAFPQQCCCSYCRYPPIRRLKEKLNLLQVREVTNAQIRTNYPVKRILGKGTFGTVYETEVSTLSYAVKCIPFSKILSGVNPDEEIYHVAVEIYIGGIIPEKCTNLNKVFTSFFTEDCIVLVLEFFPGTSLIDVFVKQSSNLLSPQRSQRRRLDARLSSEIFVQVLQGVKDLHDMGIVHRDLKPDNILVGLRESDGKVLCQVADYGKCRIIDQELRVALKAPLIPPGVPLAAVRWYDSDYASEQENTLFTSRVELRDLVSRFDKSVMTAGAGTYCYMPLEQLRPELHRAPKVSLSPAQLCLLDAWGCGAVLLCLLHKHMPGGNTAGPLTRASLSRTCTQLENGCICPLECIEKHFEYPGVDEARSLIENLLAVESTKRMQVFQAIHLATLFYNATHPSSQERLVCPCLMCAPLESSTLSTDT